MTGRRERLPIEDLRDECLTGADCLYDPELHDGPAGVVEAPDERAARVEVAKEVCAGCPVLDACLAYALRTRPASGVWAGHTADELAALPTVPEPAPDLGEVA